MSASDDRWDQRKYHLTTMLGALRVDETVAAMADEGDGSAVMEMFAETQLRRSCDRGHRRHGQPDAPQ